MEEGIAPLPPQSGHRVPWGKLETDAGGKVVAERSLVAHCQDVAAVLAALVALPGYQRRLARLAGQAELSPVTMARLAYFALLHDSGKVNTGFQARRNPKAEKVGHIAPLITVLGNPPDPRFGPKVLLPQAWFHEWGVEGARALLDAAFSHHGLPWPADKPDRRWAENWEAAKGMDPLQELERLFVAAETAYPAAFTPQSPALPVAPGFVHAVAGLIQLADWIASSDWHNAPDGAERQAWASQWLVRIGLDPRPWREPPAGGVPDILNPDTFEAVFGFSPRPVQQQAAMLQGNLVLVESETGSGKTEAALWRFLTLFRQGDVDGLFFALPTRTAAVQLYQRVQAMVSRVWPGRAPPLVLAVPGYLEDDTGNFLPPASERYDTSDEDGTRVPKPEMWASQHPKRYFTATLAVGTLDQALLAVLQVKHAHLRGAALIRHLLVVDEVHASDSYMQCLLNELLVQHRAAGGHALLLSATLGGEARARLLGQSVGPGGGPSRSEAVATPYPLISALDGDAGTLSLWTPPETETETSKTVAIRTTPLLDAPEQVARQALEAAQAGAKVLVIRNTVAGAIAVHQALLAMAPPGAPELFRVSEIPALHHGRFAREDRRLLDAAVEQALGKTRPAGGRVVIGTQTLEQSLDIDADLLITDLAPVDVLLQRLGRLFRHRSEPDGTPRRRPAAAATPQAVVLVPEGDLTPFLGKRRPRHGLGPQFEENGAPRGVYPDLTILEATWRLITVEPEWRIPAMNRYLVEQATHSGALEEILCSIPHASAGRWRKHYNAIQGVRFADKGAADSAVLRRDKPLMNEKNRFDSDERLTTRLGHESLLFTFPEGTLGPFGHPIHRISIPGWMAESIALETLTVHKEGPVLHFQADGKLHFTYGAFGLTK